MYGIALKYYEKYQILLNYCLIGCSGTALDFAVFSFLYWRCGIHYQYANFVSFSCCIVNNYLLNSRFNFRTSGRFFTRLLSFYLVGMVGWSISAALLYLLAEKGHLHLLISKLIIICVTTITNFNLNMYFTFRRSPIVSPRATGSGKRC